MGATHFAAVLCNGEWIQVSNHPRSKHLGRDRGWENYKLDVADDAITAQFNRSNSGNEHVEASNGTT